MQRKQNWRKPLASQNSPLPTVAVGGIAEILVLSARLGAYTYAFWLLLSRGSAHGPAGPSDFNGSDPAGLKLILPRF
jgi:hypothetical protein